MALITQTDIENVVGTEAVRVWSNLEPDVTAADTDRVAMAIANAEYDLASMFKGSPWDIANSTNVKLTHWRAVLAAAWLYEARRAGGDDEDHGVLAQKKAAMEEMAFFMCGARRFHDLQTAYPTPMAPHIALPPETGPWSP